MTLNIENIDELIKFFKHEGKNHFEMPYWTFNYDDGSSIIIREAKTPRCGTVMCVGGTCNFLATPVGEVVRQSPTQAAKWLGISAKTACHLFHMSTMSHGDLKTGWSQHTQYGKYVDVTYKHAIAALEMLKATGTFNKSSWEKIAPEAVTK